MNRVLRLCIVIAVGCMTASSTAFASNIRPNSYAWSENAGWINFAPNAGPGVTVSSTGIAGYAWAENLGWINFGPFPNGVTNNGTGTLGGYAWSENAGWINFAPIVNGVATPVVINPATGVFSGYAWGENIGWINFDVPSPVTVTLAPALTGASSRKAHGGAGTFDLPLAP